MEKTFRSDNKNVSITLPASDYEKIIEVACKRLFDWRTPTKRFNTMVERWQSQGSVNYDKVIVYLHNCGY